MRVPPAIAAILLVPAVLAPSLATAAVSPADVALEAGPVSSIQSVSPDVFYDEASSTYYLFTTGMGIGVYTSPDGESWSAVPGASTPSMAFDPSIVAMPDSTYRMYFTSPGSSGPGQPCSGKQLKYATSSDLVRWTTQSDVLLRDLGCGVPNVVRAGEADYRLYYVRGGEGVKHGTYMATSPDGLNWTPRDVLLTPTDMVDPSVVRLADGSWLMLTADFPASKSGGPFLQKLYAATSPDGFTWDFGSVTPLDAAPAGQGAFDPDAVVMPDGSVRVWWAQELRPQPARVAAGTLVISIDPDPVVPASPAKPKATWTAKALKASWTYPVGAPAPEAFAVQVRTTGAWTTVATVPGARATASIPRAKLPKSAFVMRVVATIGDETAASPPAKVAKPR